MTELSRRPVRSMEANMRGTPAASTSTPIICTMVTMRNSQSSVSYAEENHEKLIQAQQMARLAKPNPTRPAMTWPSASTEAASEAARPKLVANVKSNRSSSGVTARCASCGSRPVIRRESRGMTPVPAFIVLIRKDLSVVRRNEIRRADTMGSSSGDEIVDGRVVTLARVVNQTEMNADGVRTMEVEVCPHRLVRVHVHPIHEPSRLICANGQQTDSWGAVLLVDVAKVRAVRAVAGKVNGAFRRL